MSNPGSEGQNPPSASAASSSSSSSSLSSVDSAAADRLLENRYARLCHSAPIHVSLPPPSDRELEARLLKLQPPPAPPHMTDEENLRRRFEALNAGSSASNVYNLSTTAAEAAARAAAPPPMVNASDLMLAGVHPNGVGVKSEADEVQALLQQMHEMQQLERREVNQLQQQSAAALSQQQRNGTSARPGANPASSHSPPVPTKAEVDALLMELESLPDSELLQQVASHNLDHPKHKKGQQNGYGSDSDSSESGSDTDDDVNDIINQAMDEARMEE